MGTVVAGGTCTIIIRGIISSSFSGTLVNIASVRSDALDTVPLNNHDTLYTPVNTQADLALTKVDSPDPVIAGQTLTYTLGLRNLGTSDAQNVRVREYLPAGLSFVSSSTANGAFNMLDSTWVLSSPFVSGDSATLILTFTVNPALLQGTVLSNLAIAGSDTDDPNPVNDTARTSTTVNAQADLAVSKLGSPAVVIAGQNLTYTIGVRNNGSSNAQNVRVKELLPAGLGFVSASTANGSFSMIDSTWTLVSPLAVGDSAALTLLFLVDPSIASGSILRNTVIVRSNTFDVNQLNDTARVNTTVSTLADIAIIKTGTPDPVVAGEVITYTITITNAGPSDAQSLAISDLLPVQLLNGQFSLNGGLSCQPWVSPYNHGTLAAGGSITIQVKGIVNANLPGGTWIRIRLSQTAAP
jgi:uncharacterized repeat protein (TIGR01451 family)